jgi:hypothetical protein
VSITGIDDHARAAVLGRTTVAQPVAAMGRLAASMLLEALTGGAPDRLLDMVVLRAWYGASPLRHRSGLGNQDRRPGHSSIGPVVPILEARPDACYIDRRRADSRARA